MQSNRSHWAKSIIPGAHSFKTYLELLSAFHFNFRTGGGDFLALLVALGPKDIQRLPQLFLDLLLVRIVQRLDLQYRHTRHTSGDYLMIRITRPHAPHYYYTGPQFLSFSRLLPPPVCLMICDLGHYFTAEKRRKVDIRTIDRWRGPFAMRSLYIIMHRCILVTWQLAIDRSIVPFS